MNNATIREQLHEYIDQVDEKFLKAIYVLLEKEITATAYDKSTLEMLNKRRENHLKGVSKSYTIKESVELARASKR